MSILGKHMRRTESEVDKLLKDFEKQRVEQPASRVAEVRKHKAISLKRDKVQPEAGDKLWKGF